MSDLSKALAAVGESAPERPILEPIEGGDECDEVNSFANRLGLHVTALESLALRLAVRLERAERCRECDGERGEQMQVGQDEYGDAITALVPCAACSGTGKEQGR